MGDSGYSELMNVGKKRKRKNEKDARSKKKRKKSVKKRGKKRKNEDSDEDKPAKKRKLKPDQQKELARLNTKIVEGTIINMKPKKKWLNNCIVNANYNDGSFLIEVNDDGGEEYNLLDIEYEIVGNAATSEDSDKSSGSDSDFVDEKTKTKKKRKTKNKKKSKRANTKKKT